MTDDQRWDTARSPYMPTVEAELSAKGVEFRNAFVVNPLCCPSRTSILTGTYSHTTGVWRNSGRYGGFTRFRDASTLPAWLDAAGYETMLIGKYLNRYSPPWAIPTYVPPGWDRWFAYWGPNYYFDYEITDGETVRLYGSNPPAYATDVMREEAAKFIRESGSAPFFLYFAPKAPHITDYAQSWFSTDPAPRHVDRFAGLGLWQAPNVNEQDISDKPSWLRSLAPISQANLTELREEQLESLLAVDEAIAGILATLEETGKLADTLIVFTSDNGWAWGEHRWVNKLVPYEESIRVPLTIRYDALGVAGRLERRFALNVDLAPTIAAAAGIGVVGAEGRSLLPLLGGQETPWRTSFLFEQGGVRAGMPSYCAFRGARWKYMQYADGTEELYDLAADRFELRNLRPSGVRRRLIMRYRSRVLASRCRPPGFRPLPVCTRIGSRGGDRMWGTRRSDWICARAGDDRIRVRGGRRDVVACGPGVDRVRADRRDRLVACERVVLR